MNLQPMLLFMSIFAIAFLSIGCPSPSPTGQVSGNCGDYGEVCCADDYCYYGECQNGKCTHCGSFGETCCQKAYSAPCEYGSACISGVCKTTETYTDDCGHIGYPACNYGGELTCYYGVLDSSLGMCIACGDYDQPCCIYTDYPCDYGTCTVGYPHTGGVCKRPTGNPTIGANTVPSWNTPDDSWDSGNSDTTNNNINNNNNCGGLNQDCCEGGLQRDMWGQLVNPQWCDEGLDCRADTCVTGVTAEAYDPYNRAPY